MTSNKYLRFFSTYLPLYLTFNLWLLAKMTLNSGDPLTIQTVNRYLSQIFSLWAIVLLAMNYLLAARHHITEKLYGGLDKIYKYHTNMGKLAFVFMLVHPLLLSLNFVNDLNIFKSFYLIESSNSLAKNFGVTALYLYTVLVLISIFKILPYNIWKLTHKFMGVPFVFAGIHMILAVSDVRAFLPLKIWMLFIVIVGFIAYLYKLILYEYIGPKFAYKVNKINPLKDEIYEIYLTPMDEKLNFEPGEFVYMKVENNPLIPKEDHPFSISSSPSKNELRLSFKVLGDYTNKLKNLKVDDKVELYGSYGEFTSYMFNKYQNQVWIAGGIGVTPFLSMLHYESNNECSKNIYFIYANDNNDVSVYDNEIKKTVEHTDDNIIYENYLVSEKGFINANYIAERYSNLKDSVILLCGPKKMMISLKDQFVKLGVKHDKIIFEDFSML